MEIKTKKMNKYIFFLLIHLSVLISCTSNKTKSQQALKTGMEFYYKSKYDSSIVYFNKAVKLDTTNSEAFYFISKSNYRIKNYKDALKSVNIAERKKFNSDSTEILRLDILFQQENYDDCITYCDKSIRRNTSNFKIYFKKSAALFNKSDKTEQSDKKEILLKEALDNVNISLKLNNTSNETFVLRGAIRYVLDDFKGAINDYNIVIKTEKKDSSILSNAYRYKGLTERDLGNLSVAETLLDSSIALERNEGILFLNRADIRRQLNKIELACEDYRKALELGKNDAVASIRENCK